MPGTLLSTLILGEVAGKNGAIHAYDRMVWTVRSGFLTLLFGGWGLLLKSLVELPSIGSTQYGIVGAMLCLSIALAIGARAIDLNYVRRKFRVIDALNRLLQLLASHEISYFEESDAGKAAILPYLKVAGDSESKSYEIAGYSGEKRVGQLIYTAPLVGISIGMGLIVLLRSVL
ncbi:MAG: hypothetical protein ABJC63_05175 [Gemmatimonadales bacterium]